MLGEMILCQGLQLLEVEKIANLSAVDYSPPVEWVYGQNIWEKYPQ